jgi:hypothetical protein
MCHGGDSGIAVRRVTSCPGKPNVQCRNPHRNDQYFLHPIQTHEAHPIGLVCNRNGSWRAFTSFSTRAWGPAWAIHQESLSTLFLVRPLRLPRSAPSPFRRPYQRNRLIPVCSRFYVRFNVRFIVSHLSLNIKHLNLINRLCISLRKSSYWSAVDAGLSRCFQGLAELGRRERIAPFPLWAIVA